MIKELKNEWCFFNDSILKQLVVIFYLLRLPMCYWIRSIVYFVLVLLLDPRYIKRKIEIVMFFTFSRWDQWVVLFTDWDLYDIAYLLGIFCFWVSDVRGNKKLFLFIEVDVTTLRKKKDALLFSTYEGELPDVTNPEMWWQH